MFLRNATVDKHGVSHPRVASSGASTGFRANALLGKPRARFSVVGRYATILPPSSKAQGGARLAMPALLLPMPPPPATPRTMPL